jgi:hypothetical protein
MAMDGLRNLIAPPADLQETGDLKAWEKIEAQLGLQLPLDYKAFINLYGSGSFDGFLMVYNPFSQNEYLNLFFALDTLHEADQQTRRMGDPTWTAVWPFELYPAVGGLLPWGFTTQLGQTFFWQIKGPPESWETIFYNLRNGEYEVWKYQLTEFLYRLLTRKIASVLLPEDFPSIDHPITFQKTGHTSP